MMVKRNWLLVAKVILKSKTRKENKSNGSKRYFQIEFDDNMCAFIRHNAKKINR